MSDKAVFLDRDNTLIDDPGYIGDPSLVRLLPGVEQAVKSLQAAGYKIVVVTNQSGIARGLITVDALEKIHDELRRQLAAKEAFLDAIYYCPFHPEGTVEEFAKESELRKPRPGMLLKAASELDLDLARSWMVGDSPRDIEAGQRAGCRTIRVRTRAAVPSAIDQEDEDVQADYTVRNLAEAARAILESDRLQGEAVGLADGKVGAESAAAISGESAQEAGLPRESRSQEDADIVGGQELLRQILHQMREQARRNDPPPARARFFIGLLFSAALGSFVMAVYIAWSTENAARSALWMLASLCLAALSVAMHLLARGRRES